MSWCCCRASSAASCSATARTCGRPARAPSAGAVDARSQRQVAGAGRSDPWESDDLGDGVVATTADARHPHRARAVGHRRLQRDLEDDHRALRRRAGTRRTSSSRTTGAATTGSRPGSCSAWPTRSCTRNGSANPDAKLILIGHSMGGLVARYFLECLDGWRDTRMLITFGTPHRGSLNAVDFLVNGFVKKVGPLKVADLTTLLRSLTSVYQLLPIYPCVDLGDGYERVAEVGDRLPGVDRARAASALTDFHRAIEAGVGRPRPGRVRDPLGRRDHARARSSPAGCEGDRLMIEEPTAARTWAATAPCRGSRRRRSRPTTCSRRTSRCTRRSATASLQTAEAVQTQLLGILTAVRGPGSAAVQGVRLEADELLSTRRAAGRAGAARSGQPDAAGRRARTSPPARSSVRRSSMRRDADEVHHAEIAPLPAGDYRLRVEGVGDSAGLADPVHGLVCVDRRRRARRRSVRSTGDDVRPARRHRRLRAAAQPAVRVPQRHRRARARTSRARSDGEPRRCRCCSTARRRGTPWSARSATTSAGRGGRRRPVRLLPATAARSRRRRRSPTSSRPGGSRR